METLTPVPLWETCSTPEGAIRCYRGVASGGTPWAVYCGDARGVLAGLPDAQYDCVVTSPPYYWQRDYGVDGQMGLEATVGAYVEAICGTMDEVLRVLKASGTLFLNLGDTYYSGKGQPRGPDPKSRARRLGLRAVDRSGGLGLGIQPKSVIGIPWRVALEMVERRGWTLRRPIVWHQKYCLPEPVTDRPRRSYEYVFLFTRARRYYFDRSHLADLDVEDVWPMPDRPKSTNGLDTAPFPDELVERCLNIGCPPGGSVLDPFASSGTTLREAVRSGRPAEGIDINPRFCEHIATRLLEM